MKAKINSHYGYKTRILFSQEGGINSDHTFLVNVEFIGKSSNDESPYLLANEYIAARIGYFLGLPIPPFSIVQSRKQDRMFVSHRFLRVKAGGINPREFVERHPELSASIVVFDVFVANADRHSGNIRIEIEGGRP
ncbi:MAG TPA: hypothetical protein VM260_26605, partial [Pirellula sp.]|nr:hypothetical protein [Pirellula sp.]